MVQDSFAEKLGIKPATFIDALFFGLTHLAHYGIVITATSWIILPSALIWVVLMMLTSFLFSLIRAKSGNLWAAVVCHAGFNLGMMWSIFYLIN